jgi:hypothetical protein
VTDTSATPQLAPQPPPALERWTEWSPAYDKRSPDPSRNYGVHGVDMRWYVRGPLGAVQFVVHTNWMLEDVRVGSHGWDIDIRKSHHHGDLFCAPLPADLGYHSRTPMHEGQVSMDDCDLIGGVPCFYDGSGLNAAGVFALLVMEGSEAVWERLERYYRSTFEAGTA